MNSSKVMKSMLKNFNQTEVVSVVDKMLKHFETFNFLNLTSENNPFFSFNAANLKQMIKNEWLLTNIVRSDQLTFEFPLLKSEKSFKVAYEKVVNSVSELPFSLIDVDNSLKENVELVCETKDPEEKMKNLFKICNGEVYRTQTLCSPSSAIELFYKKQRDRNVWWRKFSALPSRFSIGKISNGENSKSQFVEIQAEFPWGFEPVETIRYHPEMLNTDDKFFEMKNLRKKIIPQIIACEISLEKATLTYLCDSFEGINDVTDREMLRFSRKLAPYKVAFAGSGGPSEITRNLKDLALLLAKQIRKCGIYVLLLPDLCSLSLEKQFLRNDALGVPYTIVLNEKSLKDGMIAIRSRDTTLKEQSHVSMIVSYVEKLMQNY